MSGPATHDQDRGHLVNRLRWLITLPVAIVVVVFAVNNRGAAEVSLWPFDMIVAWPMFVFVFIGAGIGFLVGATVMWLSSAPARRKSRERAGRVRQLERDAARNTGPESPDGPRAIAPRTPARTG
ncbi:MAG: LapA family protein [Alphaproteobacteria bacterium]